MDLLDSFEIGELKLSLDVSAKGQVGEMLSWRNK